MMPRLDAAVIWPACRCLERVTTTSAMDSPLPTMSTEASRGIVEVSSQRAHIVSIVEHFCTTGILRPAVLGVLTIS